MIRVARIERLPDDIEILRAEAERDGVRNVGRLVDDWASGQDRYDRPGEALFAAFDTAATVGLGGVAIEPGQRAMRMRRMFVRPAWRKRGVGRLLADAMIARGLESADLLTCNAAPPGAAEFWEAMGFHRVTADGHTHERER